MTFVILFVLAVAWAWYLLTWYSGRREQRNVNSISSFSKHLSVLERTSPSNSGMVTVPGRAGGQRAEPRTAVGMGRPPVRAMTRSQAQVRRRNVVLGLGVASMASVLAAWFVGGPFGWLAAIVLVVAVGYVGLLFRTHALTLERSEKVHYLHVADQPVETWDSWDDEAYEEFAHDSYPTARLAR